MPAIRNLIIEDLLAETPENVFVTPPPYNTIQALDLQVLQTYRHLQRATIQKDQRQVLTHVFYLEEQLEHITNQPLHRYLCNLIPNYYRIVSKRIYYLFEKIEVDQI